MCIVILFFFLITMFCVSEKKNVLNRIGQKWQNHWKRFSPHQRSCFSRPPKFLQMLQQRGGIRSYQWQMDKFFSEKIHQQFFFLLKTNNITECIINLISNRVPFPIGVNASHIPSQDIPAFG